MPQARHIQGKHQRRAPKRRRAGYGYIPLTALAIFLVIAALIQSGAGGKIESAIIDAAKSDRISKGLLTLVLPEGQAVGDAPRADDTAPAEETSQPHSDEPPVTVPDEDTHDAPAEYTVSGALVAESVFPGQRPANAPPDAGDITALTISGSEDGYEGSGTVYMRNDTDFKIDIPALLKAKNPVKLSGSGVQVLIMHTHGTEAYTPDAQYTYTATDTDRTTDASRNMLRVGDEIANVLEKNGIKVIHSTALNDYPAYNGSYNRALTDIAKYVKDNPSIKVVIDVHRDAMVSKNGTKYKTVATIDGKPAAQLMFVAGTDQGGLTHDNWRTNLAFQLKLHDRLSTAYPGIMRPINIRTGRFNQHVTTGSMLLEVGTSGNGLGEALYSAQLFAQTLSDMLNGK